MDAESAYQFVATVSIFLASCTRYGHDAMSLLSSMKAPKRSESKFSTDSVLITFTQNSLDYVKKFIQSLLTESPHTLAGNFDIADVLRASLYLQLRTSDFYQAFNDLWPFLLQVIVGKGTVGQLFDFGFFVVDFGEWGHLSNR